MYILTTLEFPKHNLDFYYKCSCYPCAWQAVADIAKYPIKKNIRYCQKYLGVTVSCDLTWTTHIHEQVTKANRMLGLLKRSAAKVHNVNTRRCLYLGLVRSNLAHKFASQIWNPQTITLCAELERI